MGLTPFIPSNGKIIDANEISRLNPDYKAKDSKKFRSSYSLVHGLEVNLNLYREVQCASTTLLELGAMLFLLHYRLPQANCLGCNEVLSAWFTLLLSPTVLEQFRHEIIDFPSEAPSSPRNT